MKFNCKELADYSYGEATIEGRLHHKRITNGFSQSGFKEKWFKLRANILFYFSSSETGKAYDKKPVGAFILENAIVQHEMNAEAPFAFSIVFPDDFEKKHLFSGRTEEYVTQWVNVLNQASYEFWRTQLMRLQKQLCMLTGKGPEEGRRSKSESRERTRRKKSRTLRESEMLPLAEASVKEDEEIEQAGLEKLPRPVGSAMPGPGPGTKVVRTKDPLLMYPRNEGSTATCCEDYTIDAGHKLKKSPGPSFRSYVAPEEEKRPKQAKEVPTENLLMFSSENLVSTVDLINSEIKNVQIDPPPAPPKRPARANRLQTNNSSPNLIEF